LRSSHTFSKFLTFREVRVMRMRWIYEDGEEGGREGGREGGWVNLIAVDMHKQLQLASVFSHTSHATV
jgi:hypothetical protein